MKDSTSVMVTHRLDQLYKTDKILVLDRGCIVQRGSFSELNSADGLFRQMQTDDLSPDDSETENSLRNQNIREV
jgi:ATP-binding cassette subfamily C protein CydD